MNSPMSDDVVVTTAQKNPAILNHIRLSIDITFASFYSSGLEYLGSSDPGIKFDGIVGIISLVGKTSCTLALGLPKDLATKVSEHFMGFKIDYDSEDMGDLIGELINIAGGDAIARLDSDGIKTELSLPTITRGNPLQFFAQEKTDVTRLNFSCPDGQFWLDVALSEQTEYPEYNESNEQSPKSDETQEIYDMNDASGAQGALFPPEQLEGMKQSVLKCFGSICNEDIQFIGFNPGNPSFDGIVGIVSLVGTSQTWSLMFGFAPDVATKIGEKFAGFEIEYDSDDMGDVVGELANVVAGDAAIRLDSLGLKADLSIPTIARGHDINMLISKDIAKMHYDFRSQSGDFWMKLATEKH